MTSYTSAKIHDPEGRLEAFKDLVQKQTGSRPSTSYAIVYALTVAMKQLAAEQRGKVPPIALVGATARLLEPMITGEYDGGWGIDVRDVSVPSGMLAIDIEAKGEKGKIRQIQISDPSIVLWIQNRHMPLSPYPPGFVEPD